MTLVHLYDGPVIYMSPGSHARVVYCCQTPCHSSAPVQIRITVACISGFHLLLNFFHFATQEIFSSPAAGEIGLIPSRSSSQTGTANQPKPWTRDKPATTVLPLAPSGPAAGAGAGAGAGAQLFRIDGGFVFRLGEPDLANGHRRDVSSGQRRR